MEEGIDKERQTQWNGYKKKYRQHPHPKEEVYLDEEVVDSHQQ
jgi:hypothetical protein